MSAAQPPEQHRQSHSNEPAESRQSQSDSADLSAKVQRIAVEQVQKECEISAAPTDKGYRHLYNMEINRRSQQILQHLRKRAVQRENRKTKKQGMGK